MSRLLKLIGIFAAIVAASAIGRLTDIHSASSLGSETAPRQHTTSTPSVPSPSVSATYTQAEIDYFLEIAMGPEFPKSSSESKIRKWQGDINIQYSGAPTSQDLATLESVVRELNTLTNGEIHLQLVNHNPNITLHFAPLSQFAQLEPGYQPGNYGYFWDRWDENNTLNHANVLVTTTKVTQKERSHLIREELTQSLGLMQDSYKYPDSMFYQPWTDPTEYSAMDRVLIRMLYSPQVKAGMTKAQVLDAIKSNHLASG